LSTPNAKPVPAAEPAPQQPTAESLGWQLRAALPPMRLHSISLHDHAGEVLWLSEGALGPDEHGFVVDAVDALTRDPTSSHRESDLQDGRGAVFLAIRSPQADLVGLVMILVDAKALAANGLPARILAPPVKALLQRLAILLRPAPRTPAVATSATARNLEIIEWSPPEPPATARIDSTGEITVEVLGPKAVDDILTFELAEDQPPRPGASSAKPDIAPAAGELYIRELAKLRPGGLTRRFQLLSRRLASEPAHAEPAERAVTGALRELAAWLDIHAPGEERGTLHFSIAVPAAALSSASLPQEVAECLRASGLAADCIGFELMESACVKHLERAQRFAQQLETLGCFLVLDEFAFDSRALELLRSKALRLVKVDRTLTAAALRDKLAQARIVAISQAARVLGIHCAAKQVDAPAAQRWLAAAGFDFAEGAIFGGPRPIASLAAELADRR
jgi:EAL domain-containing protein (putative c-di-GMP-specific phosphodiesterase class I)